MGSRSVLCEDANGWMAAQTGPLDRSSVVTSLPDTSEVPLSFDAWKVWFRGTAARLCTLTPDDGVTLFFQTDIKKAGVWVDKGYLVARGAEEAGSALLFHKIVCRKPAGTLTFGRPAYAHLLAFSRGVRLAPQKAFADVLPDTGNMTWSRAMGAKACLAACAYVRDNTQGHTVVDPFCGLGTVLAAANHLGLDALGIELSRKRAQKARVLQWGDVERGRPEHPEGRDEEAD